MEAVDLSQIVEALIGALALIIGGAVAAVAAKARKALGLTIDEKNRASFETATRETIHALLSKAADAGIPRREIRMDSALMAGAIQQVASSVPDAINHFGIGAEAELRRRIETRLQPFEEWIELSAEDPKREVAK